MGVILHKKQYILIYKTSYLTLLSFLYSLYQEHYNISIVPGSIFVGAILYWSKPDYSWRRYLDMAIAKTCIIYQLYMAYYNDYAILYYFIATIGLSCYPLGIYYYKKNDYWNSTYSHMAMHIILNIGNIILYSGKFNY